MNLAKYLFWDIIPPEQRTQSPYIAPRNIDFRNWGLPFKEVNRFGHKQSVRYYASYDFDTKEYDNVLVKVDRAVTYEGATPIKLTRTVCWRLDNDTWGDPFTWSEPIRSPQLFLKKVRERGINELIEIAEAFGFQAQIVELFEKYQLLVDSYRDAGSAKFRNAIAIDEAAWLDALNEATGNKPRDVLVQYLSIGVVEDAAS